MPTLLRLMNGTDVLIKLEVAETIAALAISKESLDFVELPGEDGPVHVRPSSVIAVLESTNHRTTGFRAG